VFGRAAGASPLLLVARRVAVSSWCSTGLDEAPPHDYVRFATSNDASEERLMDSSGIRQLTPLFQKFLYVAVFLTFGAGVPLFLLSAQTDRFFSWTINPPLTAAWLGATFWAASVIVLLAARQPVFAYLRPAMPGGLLFVWLMLGATLLHLDRFHLDRATGIAWVAVYVAVPPILTFILWRQFTAPGEDPPRAALLPGWLRFAFALYALVVGGIGLALYLLPAQADAVWPWTLTPLTARALAAWLIPLGVIAAQLVWENDFVRIRAAMIGATAFAGLNLVAVARYSGTIDWAGAAAWLYLATLGGTLIVAVYSLLAGRQVPQSAPSAA
jgi:hypothetical protein